MNKTVAVFGSSIPITGDIEYEAAYKLGKIFGVNGLNVCSGGYQGIMDAVSKGASECGVQAIGVTVNLYNSVPSRYLTKEIKCSTLFERISKLLELGDAYVILEGGTGTLLELSVVWEYLNKNLLTEKPVACYGNMWKEIVNVMESRIADEKRKTGLIKCFDSIDDVAGFIITSLK
ncbi:MAG: DNA-binding protein [Ignavibacteria bacterium RBG_13_36_8]|nr:MAG: DNA-binding protein [Ignavibacteria bacterium RBG_13_36_8]